MEWVQNIQRYRWSEERVNSELEGTMKRAYGDLKAACAKHECDFRTGAFAVAIDRVNHATSLRGVG
jgi:glutamate dehydrogenase (NAD(P)+)